MTDVLVKLRLQPDRSDWYWDVDVPLKLLVRLTDARPVDRRWLTITYGSDVKRTLWNNKLVAEGTDSEGAFIWTASNRLRKALVLTEERVPGRLHDTMHP